MIIKATLASTVFAMTALMAMGKPSFHVASTEANINLTTNKVAFIVTEVNRISADAYERQIWDTLEISGDRLVVINSPGGYLDAGNRIIDMINFERALGTRTICMVTHKAQSMAFNILTHCDVRLAVAKATLMFHRAAFEYLDDEAAEGRLTAPVLRKKAAELDADDERYAAANCAAMKMCRSEYYTYGDHDRDWKAEELVTMKYLQGIATISVK